mmetsp:Transcript_25248/g.39091  ORF Transcript_25248/g.39091 Transcript_25248/m.39091 type:complete len:223 (-) Transcript_25248:182-850(-)
MHFAALIMSLPSLSPWITLHHKVTTFVFTILSLPRFTLITELIHFTWINRAVLLPTGETNNPQTIKTERPNTIFLLTDILLHRHGRYKFKLHKFVLGRDTLNHTELTSICRQVRIIRQYTITGNRICDEAIHANLLQIFGCILGKLGLYGHAQTAHSLHCFLTRDRFRWWANCCLVIQYFQWYLDGSDGGGWLDMQCACCTKSKGCSRCNVGTEGASVEVHM